MNAELVSYVVCIIMRDIIYYLFSGLVMAILLVLVAYTLSLFSTRIEVTGNVYGLMQLILFFLWCVFLIGVLKMILFGEARVSRIKEFSLILTIHAVLFAVMSQFEETPVEGISVWFIMAAVVISILFYFIKILLSKIF